MSEHPTSEAEPDNDEQRELAAWLKLKRKAVRERDEAREEGKHWKTEYEIVVARLCGKKHPRDNGIISEHEIIPKLTNERDAWREMATELADAAAYGLAQWDDGYSPEVSCKIGETLMRFQKMQNDAEQ